MYSDNWLPTPINQIVPSLNFYCKDYLKKNIAYNYQYLEYLIHIEKIEQINKLFPTWVIIKMRYKSFIVVAMGIIESIFISLLEEKNLIPLDCKKINRKEIKINATDTNVNYIRRTINKFKKLNFDEIVELMKNNNILNIEQTDYDTLIKLKKLRNKIHIEKASCFIESDYNSFDHITYKKTRILLYNILKSSKVTNQKYNLYLEYLKED